MAWTGQDWSDFGSWNDNAWSYPYNIDRIHSLIQRFLLFFNVFFSRIV